MSPEPSRRPGILVMVVGPSGAGKDAVMRGARDRLGPQQGIVFARRVITRPADASEDNDAATPEEFAVAAASGAFVLDWEAHGLRYGVPRQMLEPMTRGAVVVVNGSRSAVMCARAKIDAVRVVLVTAPPAILAVRIRARGREADLGARLARDVPPLDALGPDVVIDNDGPLPAAVDRLVQFLVGEDRPGALVGRSRNT